jgi:hypothetical protein
LIAGTTFVVAVLIWSIFRTGQTAIRSEARDQRRTASGAAEPAS